MAFRWVNLKPRISIATSRGEFHQAVSLLVHFQTFARGLDAHAVHFRIQHGLTAIEVLGGIGLGPCQKDHPIIDDVGDLAVDVLLDSQDGSAVERRILHGENANAHTALRIRPLERTPTSNLVFAHTSSIVYVDRWERSGNQLGELDGRFPIAKDATGLASFGENLAHPTESGVDVFFHLPASTAPRAIVVGNLVEVSRQLTFTVAGRALLHFHHCLR